MQNDNNEMNNQQDMPQENVVRTSRLAITAFILAVIGIVLPIFWLIALSLGIISLIVIATSKKNLKGKGFAITSIILPVVCFTVFAVFVVPKVQNKAKEITSLARLQGLAKAIMVYTSDHNGQLPDTLNWPEKFMFENDLSPNHFYVEGEDGIWAYALNKNLSGLVINDIDPDTVLLFEAKATDNALGDSELMDIERFGDDGIYVLFVDGSIEFINTENIEMLKWEP